MRPWRSIAASAAGAGAAALGVSLLFAGSDDGVSLAIYLAAVSGVVLIQVLRWPGGRWRVDRQPVAPLVERRPPTPVPSIPGAVTELEGLLAEGAHSARAANRRLRPRLVEVTEARLLDRRGIRLGQQPRQAFDILGPAAWAVVAPDRPIDRPLDPYEVEQLVHRLEQL